MTEEEKEAEASWFVRTEDMEGEKDKEEKEDKRGNEKEKKGEENRKAETGGGK